MRKNFFIKATILFFLFLASNISYCQTNNSEDTSEVSVQTDVFWLDLCNPSHLNTLRKTGGRDRLESNWKNLLGIELRNSNQFKYDYSVNSVPLATFVDTTYSSFSNSLKAGIDLTSNPFFILEIQNQNPNKKKFSELKLKLEETYKKQDDLKNKLGLYHSKYNFQIYDDIPTKLQNIPAELKEYQDYKTQFANVIAESNETFQELMSIVLSNQKESMELMMKRLPEVELILFKDTLQSTYLKKTIRGIPDIESQYDYQTAIRHHKQVINVYQTSAQIIKSFFGRFEIEYQKEENYLNTNECLKFNDIDTMRINKLIYHFTTLREIFFDLQNLYTLNPLEDKYLDNYLSVIAKYNDFLFKKYMDLQKISRVKPIYIIPTSTNMKNFDMVNIEIEKVNKVTKQKEKYSYDIYIRGGLKVDFSAGVFATSLINHEYAIVDSLNVNFEPTNKKMIRRVGNGDLNIGFGGMVNITKRTGASWMAPGMSFGLLVSTKPSLQFASSLTLSIGKTERLLLHAGYAMGFVKRVDGLPLNENIPAVKIGDDVRTIDKFLVRPFFGLTYNLSKNKVFKATSFMTSSSGG